MKMTTTAEAHTLVASVTKTDAVSAPNLMQGLGEYRDLVITLDITQAERIRPAQTYDFYITGEDGVSRWDIVHFPQIASDGAKRYTAIVAGSSRPVNTTTASPGVEAVTTATLRTEVAGANNGIRTLAAGSVRHGAFGDRIGYELVFGDASGVGITYSITVTPKK